MRRLRKTAIALAILVLVVLVTVFAVRAIDSLRGPDLAPWHTFVPDELTVAEMDATDWLGYLAAEGRIFDSVRDNVTRDLTEEYEVDHDRYFEGAPMYPGHFFHDYNRSYTLEPAGEIKGVAVFLHGLTDAPFSLRHIAELYQQHGFAAFLIRIPGHGTVPAGLTSATWEDWMAATRLAVRAAVARAGPDLPLHVIGYSNGGALAVKYALNALEDESLHKPDRLVLLSPMIGVTRFARFSGLAALPAIFPPFIKAAWLNIVPEYNPFKYNSFPVNAARQSYRLTRAVQADVEAAARAGRIGALPPILTFQSAIDFTVSASAVVNALYDRLEENGSELVLFDINRDANLDILFRDSADTAVSRILSPAPRKYRTGVIGVVAPGNAAAVERVVLPGSTTETVEPLGIDYPPEVFSMSHIALPFPPRDGLYGSDPDPAYDFGITLGNISTRGETGALMVGLDTLLRNSSNPFYDFMAGRIEEGIDPP